MVSHPHSLVSGTRSGAVSFRSRKINNARADGHHHFSNGCARGGQDVSEACALQEGLLPGGSPGAHAKGYERRWDSKERERVFHSSAVSLRIEDGPNEFFKRAERRREGDGFEMSHVG